MSQELAVGQSLAADYIARSGALRSAFVLVDIGVRDGIHPRWRVLEPALEVYGFDALATVEAPNDRHHYFTLAIGERDGECHLHVPANLYEVRVSADGDRCVPMARLDTLWKQGTLKAADFIKIDCEGYEPEILRGAEKYLDACNLLGADIESNYHVSPSLPESHFAAVSGPMIAQRLLVADLALARALDRDSAWNGTCNVLFARHLVDERHHADNYGCRSAEQDPSADTVLKAIALFDVYGLAGPATALIKEFRDLLAARLDVDLLYAKATARDIRRHLPSLGLGLWTRGRRLLAAYHAVRRRHSTAS